VAIAGSIFVLTAGVGLRERVITAVPDALKHAIGVGIGLLIALVGLEWSGVITASAGTFVTLGRLTSPPVLLALGTLALMAVLDWLPAAGETLFFSSTSEVYAGSVGLGLAPVPTPEDVPLAIADAAAPRAAYAISKLLGEAAVIHAGRARGLRWVIGRYHNVYGPRMGADHVIPEMALRAIRREDPFLVYGPGQRRAFCHVADAVEATLRLATTESAAGHVVNIGNDSDETVIEDLAVLVCRRAGYAPALERRSAPVGSPERRCPDLTRLHALTGLTPKVSLEAGAAETLDWYRAWWQQEGTRS
jgi:UDP-glucose 4-epimerase/UDP-glucuronate decarboxylase